MTDEGAAVGQAKTVLVFGKGDGAASVVTTIGVRAAERASSGAFHISGPVEFDQSTTNHLHDVVLPLVRRLLGELGLEMPPIEISVTNLSAASSLDVGLTIAGFSADTSLFLSLLSAITGMPVRQGIVSTGHIASSEGDIRMVKNLPAKLKSSLEDPETHTFVHPNVEIDRSLKILSPKESRDVEEAVASARGRIYLVSVTNIYDLLRTVFTDEDAVMASLRHDYYEDDGVRCGAPDSAPGPLSFLRDALETRFWSSLERRLLQGDSEGTAGRLLEERVRFHTHRKAYPSGFGVRLFNLLQSVPRPTRRLKIQFPLIPVGDCLELVTFASVSDFDDARRFLDSVAGDRFSAPVLATEGSRLPEPSEQGKAALEAILSEINAESLVARIGSMIDDARISYALDSSTVQSNEEFLDTVKSYYVHMGRHLNSVTELVDEEGIGREASALVERAFARRGGIEAGQAEARDGIHGGLRAVLDILTAQFKAEEQEKHINMVFKEVLSTKEYDDRLALVEVLIDYLGPQLPIEVRSSPPERYFKNLELIIRTYVQSLEEVKKLFRQL